MNKLVSKIFLLLNLAVGFNTNLFAQNHIIYPTNKNTLTQASQWNASFTPNLFPLFSSLSLTFSTTPLPKEEEALIPTKLSPPSPLPAAFCYEDLAIFCKLEYKMEKKFRFPVKIRLGEVQYTEKREGKN